MRKSTARGRQRCVGRGSRWHLRLSASAPPRIVASGFYRYVRNPIYAGFLAVLTGEVLLFGSPGLLEYTAAAWCIGAAVVRFYEEPTLARKFGAEYHDYRRAVRARIPRLHPWTPGEPPRTGSM